MEEGVEKVTFAELTVSVTISVTLDIGVDDLAIARQRFIKDVRNLRLTITKDKQKTSTSFTNGEVIGITNLFFSEMIALGHLKNLISY